MEPELLNKKILIVDDDERNTFALSNYLETYEMNVFAARDGREAIRFLEKNKNIDIILLDMMMPVMDGFETLDVLKQNEELKKIPVIAVTAKAMKGDREKCISAGAWDYLAKPVDLKACIKIIKQLL